MSVNSKINHVPHGRVKPKFKTKSVGTTHDTFGVANCIAFDRNRGICLVNLNAANV